MNEKAIKSINLNEMHDLIDLYKYASIDGERVEFIVYPTKDNKRIVTIGLQNGFSKDRDTFIFDDGNIFDETVYPELLSYFTHDDNLGNWDIVESAIEDATIKGSNETQSGNIVYLDTYNKDLYENLNKNIDSVKEEVTYKKNNLTNEDKIWDEIILYAKERRMLLDFYDGANFSNEDMNLIYDFVINVSENIKEINYGKSRKAKRNNEEILNELFKDKEKTLEYGLNDEIYNRIINTSMLKKLSHLVGIEKRLSKRLDLNNSSIKDRIDFATSELDKVEFFDLKNARKVDDKELIESKPKALNELKKIYDNEDLYDEEIRETYKEYCNELLDYLERKSLNGKKIQETKIDTGSIIFEEYDNYIIDDYEELRNSIDLIRYGKLDDEKYEIVEDIKDDYLTIRINFIDGVTKSDVYEFKFTDKEKAHNELLNITEEIFKEDPSLESTIIVNVGNTSKTTTLFKTNEDNEILLKGENDNMENDIKINDKPRTVTIDDLKRIEEELNEYMMEQEKETKEEKEKIEIKKIEDFDFLDIDLATFEIIVKKYNNSLLDKLNNGELLEDEKDLVLRVLGRIEAAVMHFNEDFPRIKDMNREEIREIAKIEAFLTTIYGIEAKYQDNKKKIEELNNKESLTPSEKLLLRMLKNVEEKFNDNDYVDDIFDVNINKYLEIAKKYSGSYMPFGDEGKQDREDLIKFMNYKMKLIDAYNALLFKKDLLNKDELERLAKYETRLYQINEIDAKYISIDKEALINEMRANEEFLLPSSKIWLSALEKECGKNKDLFEIVEKEPEKKVDYDVEEIKDAYDKALSYSGVDSPATIEVLFDKENKKEADVIISNKINNQDVIIYSKTVDIERLNNDIMPVLSELYANNNEIHYPIKFNIGGTVDYCLLLIGENRRTFKITNATKEYVEENKEKIEELVSKENAIVK